MKGSAALILFSILAVASSAAQEVSVRVHADAQDVVENGSSRHGSRVGPLRLDSLDLRRIVEERPDRLTIRLAGESDPVIVHRHAAVTTAAPMVVASGRTEARIASDDLLIYRGRPRGGSGSQVVIGASRTAGFGVVLDEDSAIRSFSSEAFAGHEPEETSAAGTNAARCRVEYADVATKTSDDPLEEGLSDLFAQLAGSGPIDTIEVPIALEADFETFEALGHSVQATATYLMTVLTAVSAVYEEELGIRLVVPFVHVWDSPGDPYEGSSISDVRRQLGKHFQADHADVDRALVHLISVKEFVDWTGIARFDALCNESDGFSVTRGKPDELARLVLDTAHEIGHSFGAHHTHSCAWPGGPLDICSPVEGSCYAGPLTQVEGTIMSYCRQTRLSFHQVVRRTIRSRAERAVRRQCAAYSSTVPFAARDSLVLTELYRSTGGDSWTNNAGWLRDPIRKWRGIRASNGNVLSLDLAGLGLHGVLPDDLGRLDWLLSLDLSDNQIEGPFPEGWTDLPRLYRLDLSRNAIASLPSAVRDLGSLVYLDASANEIAGPLQDAWTDLARLEHLDLGRNALTSLPANLSSLRSLRHLDVSQNQIWSLPESIGDVAGLESLDISGNGMERLPHQLGDLDSLKSLIGRNISLHEVPEELHKLRSLEVLDLGENSLASIPESFAALTGLRRLYLDHNQLTRLPVGLLSLPLLTEFHAQNNELAEIPEVRSPLDVLNLDNNDLTQLPAGMRTPRELGLANNKLSSLPFEPPWSSRRQGNHLGWHHLISGSGNLPFLENVLPQTLLLPDDIVVVAGQTILIPLGSKHARDTYYWSKDEGPFASGRGNPYTILSAAGTDAGTYRACVTNSWVVQSTCPDGNVIPSTATHVRVLEVRANLPEAEATKHGQTASLDVVWLNESRPSRYHVQVATTQGFSTLVFDDSTLTSDSIRIAGLDFDALYYVRVRALGDEWSAWSKPASTSTLPERAPAVVGIFPEDEAVDVPDYVRFAWESGLMPEHYLLHVANTPDFDPVSIQVTVTDTTHEVGPLEPGTQYWWRVAVVNASGQGDWSLVRTFKTGLPQRVVGGAPTELTLHPAYPNPFVDQTTLRFEIPARAHVRLRVWDVLGREVATLFRGLLTEGTYRMQWAPGSDPSGTYFIELEAGDRRIVRQVVLAR